MILINGGPGFDHRYSHAARPWQGLEKNRKIVFYDQRGTGRPRSATVVITKTDGGVVGF